MTTDPQTTHTFQVDRNDVTVHRIIEAVAADLAPGEVRLRIDRFAFTANNLTYAVVGDVLGYWQFFGVEEEGWGIIPVWGFADVVESRCDEVPLGDRLYGYFPPATSVVMTPIGVRPSAWIDGVEHRQDLPPLYNRYRRMVADAGYDPAGDDATVLLAPLYGTSFALGERLAARDFHQAEQVVIVSASSKTSLGLAFALSQRDDAPEVVGLTSTRNVDFVRGVGLYDHVVEYDAILEALPERRTVVVDMAGNVAVATAVRSRLGDDLAYAIRVGITHWDETGARGGFGGRQDPEREENFFAPSYILELVEAGEAGEYIRRSQAFLAEATAATAEWMTVEVLAGLAGLAGIYGDLCEGSLPPSTGIVVEM